MVHFLCSFRTQGKLEDNRYKANMREGCHVEERISN